MGEKELSVTHRLAGAVFSGMDTCAPDAAAVAAVHAADRLLEIEVQSGVNDIHGISVC